MYKEIDYKDFDKKENALLLIVTATNLETEYLHKELAPYQYDEIIKIYNDVYTYYIGIFGKYLTVHVQCGTMGSISRDSSLKTVSDAINFFNPKVTLMIGIAFGVDNTEQNIGDVLISECITPYNLKKIQLGVEIIRANDAPASKLLINRFKSSNEWQYLLDSGCNAKKYIAPILSGEELINDIDRRNSLMREKPTAKGGEMEGPGLYAAADGKCEWILAKGICDFADGHKDKDKEKNQIIAINSAISLCKSVFSNTTCFKKIGLNPISYKLNSQKTDAKILNKVLFERYDITKEEFYLEREIDETVKSNIDIYSIWLYGKSGYGKSCVGLRNIVITNKRNIYISLGNCIGLSVDEMFMDIYSQLIDSFEEGIISTKKILKNKIERAIITLFQQHCSGEEIYIVIDEIPLSEKNEFELFVNRLSSLVSNISNNSRLNVRFILSSIISPMNHIKEFNLRVRELIKFIDVLDWSNDECIELIELIISKLNINIDPTIIDIIIKESKGSPRFIKKVFKNSYAFDGLNLDNCNLIISETINELKI